MTPAGRFAEESQSLGALLEIGVKFPLLPRTFCALTTLAKQVDSDANGASDAPRVKDMSGAIKQLASASK